MCQFEDAEDIRQLPGQQIRLACQALRYLRQKGLAQRLLDIWFI